MSHDSRDDGIDRRAAMRALGLGGVATLAGCRSSWTAPERDPTGRALVKPPVPGAEAFATHEERWTVTSCAQCPAGCGIRVRVVEGRAVRIEGHEQNPLNEGGVGPRGLAGLQALYDPDRITGPLVRRRGALAPASWDEAVSLVAERLRALRERGRPDRLLVWSGAERGLVHELLARFGRAYGTPNVVDGRPGRSSALAQAMEAFLGVHEIPAFDWEGASCVLSLESALVEGSCQAVYLSRMGAERRRGVPSRRLRVVHAGPMLDLAALDADEWLRIRPGTSGALALGIAHVLVRDALAVAPEAYARFLEGFPPARVAAICGLGEGDVPRLAVQLVEQGPAFVFVDERSLAYSNGWETALAALALNALLGAIERDRGGLRLPPEPPLRPWPEVALDEIAVLGLARPRLDRAGSPEFPRARSVHDTIPDGIEAAAPEIALLHQANPLWARAQPARWQAALASVPFVVSFSPFMDETVAEVASVVLPDHTFLERWELVVPAPILPRSVLAMRRPVVAPLHDTRASGDVLLELARAVGGSVVAALPWRTARQASEARVDATILAALQRDGFWAAPAAPAPRAVEPAWQPTFAEPSWRGDPMAHPLELIVYRPVGHAHGGGGNQPWLHLLRDRPGARPFTTPAFLHPDAVAGLGSGDRVELRSAWGAIVVEARLDHRMARDVVAVPMGGGHRAFGRVARGVGANVLELLAPEPAPVTGSAVACGTRVSARRVGGPS
jgi:menaquinone reductase, molybdopterin-binding-like subunit